MVKKYGQEVVGELMERQHESKKWSDDEIKQLRKHYNARIKQLERGITKNETTGVSVLSVFDDLPEAGVLQEGYGYEQDERDYYADDPSPTSDV